MIGRISRARVFLALVLCSLFVPAVVSGAEKLNVLFIVADDLRPELGCYGSPALTPHLDALAGRGVRFHRAYCQQALCNPSRSSFLTGKRPDTLHLWSNGTHFRDKNPDVITLPQWFQQHGYVTRDVGKIFHNWHTKEKGDNRSWSAPEFLHYAQHADDKPMIDGAAAPVGKNPALAPRCERYDVPDEAYFDGRIAVEAIRVMEELNKKGDDGAQKPFFLAVGLWKPHAPFNAPLKYWDKYDRAKLPAFDPARPKGSPELAYQDGRELRGNPPNQVTFSAAEAAEIRHGYFAGTTYMDAQLGKVLAALDAQKLAESTVIVFLGDHGYHLGEHGQWAKTSCFELDARVPLIVVPPKSKQAGKTAQALVELVDLFPTLTELCGLPTPAGMDGTSLTPILADASKTTKSAALTQHPRPAYYDRTEQGVPEAMGYSIRTDRVRYTEWRDWTSGKVLAAELYDHQRDPGETTNAIDSAALAGVMAEARVALHKAVPPNVPPSKR